MDELLSPIVNRHAASGAAQFAHWNAAIFQKHCDSVLPAVWEQLRGRSNVDESLTSATVYIQLCAEAVGRGYLSAPSTQAPGNLMEHCLREWLPGRLASLTSERQLALFADSWNLLEGLLREPDWVNAYVLARAGDLENEPSLQSFLVRVLNPLFEPAPPSRWEGPFRETLISTRAGDEEFLPGEMQLVAPTVLTVKDRRRSIHLGFVLRKEGRTELAGTFGVSKPYAEEPCASPPRWQGSSVSFGGAEINLSFFREPFRWLQVGAGFLVASAVDSQKLWIVESAT